MRDVLLRFEVAGASRSPCHARLDPIGLGLENCDPIGRRRDEFGELPVDASVRLTSGNSFTGPAERKRILKESKRDLIVRNLIERMRSFALRRGWSPTARRSSG